MPSPSTVAVRYERVDDSDPADDHDLVAGSNVSALELPPPTSRTLPLASRVAVWPADLLGRFPVATNVRVTGLYNSDVAVGAPLASRPPVTNTQPASGPL